MNEVTIKSLENGSFYIEGLHFIKEQIFQSAEEATNAAVQRNNAMTNNPQYWNIK